jgi:hypothetical protein
MNRIDLRYCTIYIKDGLAGTAASNKKTNEKQTITLTTATGGTYTVTYDSVASGDIPYNLTPAQLQSVLEAITTIGEGNVSVTGTAGVSYVVEFIGTLAGTSLELMVIDDTDITGTGTPSVDVAETVDGGAGAAPAQADVTLNLSSVVLNSADTDLVPVGARFTIAGETAVDGAAPVHVVTARTPESTSPTTVITFTPALGAGSYSSGAVVTFAPQQVEITVGDGDMKWSEAKEYKYELDRGLLDTVREGDDQPMEVSSNFVFDTVKSGTGETITPVEAIKGTGNAAEWVSTSSTACEPYCCDIEVVDDRPCSTQYTTTYVFPDFRWEKLDYSAKDGTIAVSGKCNATEPTVTRG